MSAWAVRLLLALPVLVLATLTFPDDAEAKSWGIRISGGDLPHPILLAEDGPEAGSTINITSVAVAVQIAEDGANIGRLRREARSAFEGTVFYIRASEKPYLVECVNPETMAPLGARATCDSAGWYYPRTPDHSPLLVPFPVGVEDSRMVLPPGTQLRMPDRTYSATLHRYVTLGRLGLIGERPSRFEVIVKFARLESGKAELVLGPDHAVDLTQRYGAEIWDLFNPLRPSELPEVGIVSGQRSVRTGEDFLAEVRVGLRAPASNGETAYRLNIKAGDGSVSFDYYPAGGERPALIANTTTDLPVYHLSKELETVLQEVIDTGLGAEDAGVARWLWPLVSGIGGVALGIVATLVLRRWRTSGQGVPA